MRKFFFFIVSALIASLSGSIGIHAQTTKSIVDSLQSPTPNCGTIIIHQNSMVASIIASNTIKYVDDPSSTLMIYRIQLCNLSGSKAKSVIDKRKSEVRKTHPTHPIYIYYDAPIWRELLGDFPSKDAAQMVMKSIKNSHPDFAQELCLVKCRVRIVNQ